MRPLLRARAGFTDHSFTSPSSGPEPSGSSFHADLSYGVISHTLPLRHTTNSVSQAGRPSCLFLPWCPAQLLTHSRYLKTAG